jgi:cell division protein ZapA
MRQVAITIGGKIYRLQCRPGEEQRVCDLGDVLDGHVTRLMAETGAPLSDRLLVMAALLILDEFMDLKAKGAAQAVA